MIKCAKTILNKEEKFKNSDGNWRWTLTSKIPLIDENGKVTGLVGIGRDITEQKAANETIQKLSKGIEQNPATIEPSEYYVGGDTRVIFQANRNLVEFLKA